jgi:hypothetical protein
LIDLAAAGAVFVHFLEQDDVWMLAADDLGDAGEVQFSVLPHAVMNIPREHAKWLGGRLSEGQGE